MTESNYSTELGLPRNSKEKLEICDQSESRFGLAVRRLASKRKDLGSILFRLSFLFKSCGLWTRSCDFVPHN